MCTEDGSGLARVAPTKFAERRTNPFEEIRAISNARTFAALTLACASHLPAGRLAKQIQKIE
jgi:hypothetical protein